MKRFLQIVWWLLVGVVVVQGQQNVFSRSDAGTGDWGSANLPWFYQITNNNQGDPDNNNTTRNDVFIGHNNNLTMSLNGRFYIHRDFTFEAAASNARTLNNTAGGGFSISRTLLNNSVAVHVFNTPIGIDGNPVTFNAASGGFTFTNNVFLNANQLSINGANNITISGVMSGTGGSIIKNGSGTLTFSGTTANTYTGLTTVNAGTLVLSKSAGTAALPAALTIAAGATVRTDAVNQWGIGTPPLVTLNGNAILNLNNNNQRIALASASTTASVTLGSATLTIDNTGTDTYAGVISGTGGLIKSNTGTQILSGNNSYAGSTTIRDNGILSIDSDDRLGTPPGIATINHLILEGGTLRATGTFTINANRGGALNGGGVPSTIDVTASNILTYGGAFTSSNNDNNLIKNGTGTLVLSGNSNHASTTIINAGLLRLGATGTGSTTPLGNATNRTTVNSGAALDLNGFSLSNTEPLTINGTGISSGGALTNSSATAANWIGILTLGSAASIVANNGAINLTNTGSAGGSGAFTLTLAGSTGGSLAHNMLAAGSIGAITKEGSGTWTLSGASTYTGATTINAGTLRISGGNDRLPIATAVTIANTAGATLDLNNLNQQIGSLAGGGTTGGAVTLGSGTLTVGNTTNTIFGGNISGTGGLTKVGTGTLTMSGSNSYSGTTTISAGRLEYNSNTAMASGSAFSLGGGTLAVGNTPTALTAGALNMSASSSIDLGTGTNAFNLTFSGVGGTFTGTLTINNWSGAAGKEVFLPGLSGSQLNQINFTGYGTGAKYDGATNRIIPALVFQTITSATSGLFNDMASWTNGIPTTDACSGNPVTVIVRGNFNLNHNVDITLTRIEVNAGATYSATSNIISLCTGGSLVNNGTVNFSGTSSIVCIGTATFSGTASSANFALNNLTLNAATTLTTAPTIRGTLQLNAGSTVSVSPIYSTSSRLLYNTGGTYGRGAEWTHVASPVLGTTPGYPNDVQISNNTILNYPNTNANNTTNLSIARDLTIDAGSSLFMDFGTGISSGSVTIGRDVLIAGSLSLGDGPNGDLYVAGNFTNNGTFNHNGRALFMVGGSTQFLNGTLNATGAANCLPFLLIDKSGGTVNLNTPVNVTSTLTLTNGTITLGTNNLTITSGNAIAGGTFGTSRMIITDGTGQLVFGIPNDGFNSDLFPIGVGTNYTPITINVTGSTGTNRTIGMRVVDAAVPNTPLNTPTSPTHYITRYWVPSSSGFTSISWNGIATYAASGDAVGTAANIRFSVWHPAPENSWMDYGAGPSGQTLTGGTNITDLNALSSSAFITGRDPAPKLFYRSVGSGSWSSPTIWETATDAGFTALITPTLVGPSAMNSSGITIRSPHTVTIDAAATLDQCVVATGSTLIKGAANLSISDGSGTDFTVQNGAVFRHSGDPMTTIAGTGLVQTGGMIEVINNSTGATRYATSSAFVYETNAVFYWNVNTAAIFATAAPNNEFFPGTPAVVIPVFRINTPNINVGAGDPTIINGLFQVDANAINWLNSGTKTFRNGISGAGNVTQNSGSGAFQISGTTSILSGTGTLTLNTAGLQITGGTCTMQSSKPIAGTGTFTVNNGATLNASTFALSGSAPFTLAAGGTLVSASSTGVNGNITTSGTKTFTAGANYTFNGTTDQSTGNLMGTSIGNLTIANTGTTNNTVTLSTTGTTVTTLNLNSGVLACGAGQTLNIAGGGTIDIPASGGAGRQATGANAGTINFIGTGTVNARQTGLPQLTNVVVNATSVSFSGGSSSNATINGTLELRAGANISNAPFYANGSTLIYNTGGDYNRQVEWGTLSGPGYPHHVRIQGGTTLLANLSALTVSTWNMGGNLELGTTGSAGNLNFNGGTVRMIVNGNVVIGSNTGTSLLTLGGISGPNAGDLEIQGSFTRTANGDINFGSGLGRAVFFTGAVPATISAPAAQNFPFLIIDKGGSTANTLTLNQSVNVTQRLILTSGRVITSSSNLLTITNSAPDDASNGIVYSDGNPAYIDGPLRRDVNNVTGSNSYVFPVGRLDGSTHFAKRIRMKELTNGVGSFTVTYERGNPPGNPGPSYFFQDILKGIRESEYWNVDRTTGSTQGRMVLPYTYIAGNTWKWIDGTNVTPNLIARVAVVRGSGTNSANWNFTQPLVSNFTTEDVNPAEHEARLVTSDGDIISRHIDAFSPFTFGWGLNQVLILPLKLLGFTAKATGPGAIGPGATGPDVLLQWQYADAKDLAYTTIEYSTDGQRFGPLQRVAGTTALHYNHRHLQPGSGIHYYRLLMADKNGETTYSAVQVVQIGVNQSYITGLLQNPVQGTQAMVQGYSATAQTVRVLLSDVQGRRLLAVSYQVAQGSFSLPVSLLPVAKGNYYLQLMLNDGTSKTMKVVY